MIVYGCDLFDGVNKSKHYEHDPVLKFSTWLQEFDIPSGLSFRNCALVNPGINERHTLKLCCQKSSDMSIIVLERRKYVNFFVVFSAARQPKL